VVCVGEEVIRDAGVHPRDAGAAEAHAAEVPLGRRCRRKHDSHRLGTALAAGAQQRRRQPACARDGLQVRRPQLADTHRTNRAAGAGAAPESCLQVVAEMPAIGLMLPRQLSPAWSRQQPSRTTAIGNLNLQPSTSFADGNVVSKYHKGQQACHLQTGPDIRWQPSLLFICNFVNPGGAHIRPSLKPD